jgi:hypothetical protein
LRNELDIVSVLAELGVPTKNRGARLSFRCPTCQAFHTATNSKTNLARCFRCSRNFNPIELVMAERGSSFVEAVSHLESLLDPIMNPHDTAPHHDVLSPDPWGSCGPRPLSVFISGGKLPLKF